ncbi:protoporphyrinogen oxidase [Xyrauchen texanus]|uniref:protoporphyrinogen oxidase n=1 Tax=Xyrauchen texanus TaxID=154827 RepID=UPI002241F062|nr:protoporphyrinogen oxidase [Xyrauchen texanus]XP_052000174.1 protoporphyrinogen oxidase [Xyrauchen texanus]XP_052000175.1 protoporphyrinogen oxidase [Xyrauchen texanus]
MQKIVAVLGGGIGGLSACHHLSKSPNVSKVVLLEGGGRCGGWLSTTRREDGAVFEHGPRGVRPAGAVGRNTLNMVSELGLESEILPITKDHVASKNRYLYVKGQLHKMPSGLGGVLRTIPPFSHPIVQSVLKEMLISKGKEQDESVHGFVSRRLGSELADIAIDSLCRGVFAGDCRQLSVRSCFPPLYEAEQAWGSIVLGMLIGSGGGHKVVPCELAKRASEESWTQWSLKRGMQSLPEALEDTLRRRERVDLHHQANVKSLNMDGRGWEIKLEDGSCLKADHVISALPATALASVLPPAAQPLSEELRSIASVTVAVVNLEYEGFILPVTGFGHLVPSSEEPGVLGVVYDSVPFPQHNRSGGPTTRLTVMMGGAWFEQTFGNLDAVTKQMLLDRAIQTVTAHLGVSSSPVWNLVALLKNCIPQYQLGHWQRLEKMRQYISNHNLPLTLVGASYDGVSVNDVIFSGRTAAEGLVGKI